MMAKCQFPDASAEVERLRVELERAREEKNFWRQYAERLQAERDDLAARLQAIQQAERELTRAKLDTAKAMRKGQAI